MPTIEASYSKKIGLPGYSSHSYSVTIRTEVADIGQVEKESNQLYALLQETVDKNLQDEGYVPEATDSRSSSEQSHHNGNGSRNYVEGVNREDYVPSPGMACLSCQFINECRHWH